MAVPDSALDTRDRLKRLPAFPPVAAKLLSLLSNPDADLHRIADMASGDATICGRLLQHANSVEFGRSEPAASLLAAIHTLGINRTREIIAAVATASYIQSAGRTGQLRRSWTHMAATAILADEIAQACGSQVELAYTAGLLHDIGRLGLLVAYPQQYEQLLDDAAARCLDVLDYERECFGANHTEIGRWLAEQWNLPGDFKVIAGRHHDPCEGVDLDLLRMVHIACRLADHFGCEVTRPLREHSYEEILEDLPLENRAKLLGREASSALETRLRARIGELSAGLEMSAEAAPVSQEGDGQDPEVEGLVSRLLPHEEGGSGPSRVRLGAITVSVAIIALGLMWLLR
jgi:putative nucleotidyltransferase with HDIG domain